MRNILANSAHHTGQPCQNSSYWTICSKIDNNLYTAGSFLSFMAFPVPSEVPHRSPVRAKNVFFMLIQP